MSKWASLVAQVVKNLPAIQETWVLSLAWEDPLEEGMATHSSILAWRTPMDRGACQASPQRGRVRHDWTTKHSTAHVKIFRHAGIYTYDTPVCTCNNPLYMLLHILLFSLSGLYEESSKHYINSCCVYWLHYYPLSTQSFMKVLPPSHLSYLLGLASPGYNNRTP